MTAPTISGRRGLFRIACLILALETVLEVRRGDGQEPDPAPPVPSNERTAS